MITAEDLLLNLVIIFILSAILRRVYISRVLSISNRQRFSHNFFMVAAVTALVFAIVHSSVALTLGLISALSVVRFRAVIKEPEELVYLALSVAMGIGVGSNQRLLTIIGFFAVVVYLTIARRRDSRVDKACSLLAITVPASAQLLLEDIIKAVANRTTVVEKSERSLADQSKILKFVTGSMSPTQVDHLASELRQVESKLAITFYPQMKNQTC